MRNWESPEAMCARAQAGPRRSLAAAPVGGGAWPDNEPTRRATSATKTPLVWRAPERPEGQAAVPEGGGGEWPGNTQTPDRLEAAARPAGPGRASSRRIKPHASTPSPTGVEGAGGSGGYGRASRRGAERSEDA